MAQTSEDSAFYPSPKSKGRPLPFIVAAQGDMQDRLVIGPQAFAEDQPALLEWLYRDRQAGDPTSAFRLGFHLGYTVAARILSLDLEETISNRRDGVVVVGLAARRANPGTLCECLGLAAKAIAGVATTARYPADDQAESLVFESLARHVAASDLDHDWSISAHLAQRECTGIPAYRLNGWRRSWRKRFSRRRPFAALLAADAPECLNYQIVSEIWARSPKTDLTIILDSAAPESGFARMFFDSQFSNPSPLLILESRNLRVGGQPARLFDVA